MHFKTTCELLMNIRQDIEKTNVKSSTARIYLDSAIQHIASAIFHLSQAEEFEKGTWELKYWKDKM